jgi:signal peptidase I
MRDVRRHRSAIFLLLSLAVLAVACDEDQRAIIAGHRSYHIPTNAMEPTIHKGEYVLTRNLETSEQPVRSQIVVFQYPLDTKTIFAKRVVALPGEIVECRSKQLFVNGRPLVEPYAVHDDTQIFNDPTLPEPYRSRDNFGPVHLKADEYFILGDNRDTSNDSRYWGPVHRRFIKARVVKAGPIAGPYRALGTAG